MTVGLPEKFLETEVSSIQGRIVQSTEHHIILENKHFTHLIPWTAIADIALPKEKEISK